MKRIFKILIISIIALVLTFVSFAIGFFGGLIIGFPENVTFGYSQETLNLMNYSFYAQTEKLQEQIDQKYLTENYNLIGAYWGRDDRQNNIYSVFISPINNSKNLLILDVIELTCVNNTIVEMKQ